MFRKYKENSRPVSCDSSMASQGISDKVDKQLKNEQKLLQGIDEPKNVMISYSHANKDEMLKLKSKYELNFSNLQ